MRIQVRSGLIWELDVQGKRMLDAPEADQVAQANGFVYAEQFVKAHNGKEMLACDYCTKVKTEISFCIGASKEPEWVMWEGTGKVSCPACHEKGKAESTEAVAHHTGK